MRVSITSLFIWLALIPAIGWSQKTSRFEGKIPLVNGDSAKVQYGYYESRGKHVLQGNYTLEASSSQQEDSITFEKIIWSGNFNKNKKEGAWNYQYQLHRVQIKEIEDFKPKTTLVSQYSILNSNYTEDVASGNWTFAKQSYLQGAKTATLEEASFQFTNGVLSDGFEWMEYTPPPTGIKGKFDAKGFLHDLWEFTYMEDSVMMYEVRVYEHGFLLSLLKTERNKGDTLQNILYQDALNTLKELKATDAIGPIKIKPELHPLLFDIGYHQNSDELIAQQKGNMLLRSSIRQLLQLDTTFRDPTRRFYGSARFSYPVTKNDQANLAIIKVRLDSIQTNLESIRDRNFLELNNQYSDSLAWGIHFINQYTARLDSLYSMVAFMQGPTYHTVDPAVYIRHHARFLNHHDSIPYTFNNEDRFHIISYTTDSIASIPALMQRFEEEKVLVKKIVDNINIELKTVLKSYQLQKLDSIILNTQHQVTEEYSQVSNPVVKPVIEKFKNRFLLTEFNKMTREYSISNTFEEKLATGYDILNMLNALKDFPERIEQIYVLRDSIDNLYTEKRLDPYTFTYVDIKVKKRLYEKVADELFLEMINAALEAGKIENVEKMLTDVEHLQERLIELRFQKTVALEKQIKPKSTPEEIRKLIGI